MKITQLHTAVKRLSLRIYIYILAALFLFAACDRKEKTVADKPQVITTTTIIADIVKNVGGDFVEVRSLMGPNIDPHQYKASEGDILKIAGADAIFHNGLNLEGKFGEVLKKAENVVPSYAVTSSIPKIDLILGEGAADPHVWFDIKTWVRAVSVVADGLVKIDPVNTIHYRRNEERYIEILLLFDKTLLEKLSAVPEEKRILVTSHDAFAYFGRAYGWKVVGVQGINTASETSVNTIQRLAQNIVEEKVTCIFTETSVSPRSITALTASVNALGSSLNIGLPLYSDTLGPPEGPAGTYMGMMEYNVDAIVAGILGENGVAEE